MVSDGSCVPGNGRVGRVRKVRGWGSGGAGVFRWWGLISEYLVCEKGNAGVVGIGLSGAGRLREGDFR